jgi:transcriptional regulator with XRE-family HTH domain
MPGRPSGRPILSIGEQAVSTDNEAKPTAGDRLRAARERCGVSQSELARRLCIKPPLISRIEAAKKVPDLEWLYKAAVALGVNPHELDERLVDRRPRKRSP